MEGQGEGCPKCWSNVVYSKRMSWTSSRELTLLPHLLASGDPTLRWSWLSLKVVSLFTHSKRTTRNDAHMHLRTIQLCERTGKKMFSVNLARRAKSRRGAPRARSLLFRSRFCEEWALFVSPPPFFKVVISVRPVIVSKKRRCVDTFVSDTVSLPPSYDQKEKHGSAP